MVTTRHARAGKLTSDSRLLPLRRFWVSEMSSAAERRVDFPRERAGGHARNPLPPPRRRHTKPSDGTGAAAVYARSRRGQRAMPYLQNRHRQSGGGGAGDDRVYNKRTTACGRHENYIRRWGVWWTGGNFFFSNKIDDVLRQGVGTVRVNDIIVGDSFGTKTISVVPPRAVDGGRGSRHAVAVLCRRPLDSESPAARLSGRQSAFVVC